MIITIKGANFANSNIGTLSTYTVRCTGGGASVSPTSIEKNAEGTQAASNLVATITVDSKYTFNAISSVSVGGTALSTSDYTVSGQKVTIPAAKVTGNVVINVATEKVNTEPEEPGTGGDTGGETPSVPTIYRTNKTLGIQILEFGDFKFQSNATTQNASYHCQVVAADVSNYVGKTITVSTTHAYIKGNTTYGDAYYCFFLKAAPNNKTPEMLPSVTKLSDLGTTSGNGNMDVVLNKNIIVQKFDIVSTTDTYTTKSVTVPEGAKYIYITHTRKGGADKEANIVFN